MIRCILLLFVFASISSLSNAQIAVSETVFVLRQNEEQRKDVLVTNLNEKNTAYVKVSVFEVLNPGTPEEELVPVDNVDDISLFATPAQLAIPPGQLKQVRLVNVTESNKERVFRINFIPVVPPSLLNKEEPGFGVNVVVGYQVLLLVEPPKPVEKIDYVRNGRQLNFTNNGNVFAVIANIQQCDASGKQCEKNINGGGRLYPGNTLEVTLPYADTPFDLQIHDYDGARIETVDAPAQHEGVLHKKAQ